MRKTFDAFVALALACTFAFMGAGTFAQAPAAAQPPAFVEPHLSNIRQLTFGGQNAEAYFSYDGKRLILQGFSDPGGCDQIYTMNLDGSDRRLVSSGKGRCTCSYFTKDGKHIFFSTTDAEVAVCPPKPDYSSGYVWPVYDTYKIYLADPDGSHRKCLTPWRAYNAEGTLSPDGTTMVFTSDKDGDLELYTMDLEGKHLKRLTNTLGYDGGAFFSHDGKKICFRGWHPTDPQELKDYQDLLKQHLVRPTHMEIFVMNANGTDPKQITKNGAANFCPFFTPDDKRLIFASNMKDPKGHNFDLYLINLDGTGLEQVTTNPTFDAFPMFSPDGKHLVWASNRNGKEHETNIFLADWVENPPKAAPSALDIHAEALKQDVYTLASQDMKGRLSGTPEAEKAARYIADAFKAAGLTTVPGMTSFFRPFEFTASVNLAPGNALSLSDGKGKTAYTVGTEFNPLGFSDDAVLKDLPVVFAGFGIKAPDLQRDDYQGLDVKGKAVFIYKWGPEGDDPKSKFAIYYPLRYKAMIAREAGAAALVVLSPDPKDDDISSLKVDRGFGASGIVVLSAKRAVLEPWLKASGRSLPDAKNPHAALTGFAAPGLTLTIACKLTRDKATTENVLAWLPATTPTDQTLVVGAHYDHLGMGIEGSLADKPGQQVHPGADDNASGTAGLMELARAFAKDPARGRNVLFAAFSGEELGTLGSLDFVKHPPLPLSRFVAMLNMDMIGRLREDRLTVGGAGTSTDWKPLLETCNTEGLHLTLNEDGYGPSDHGSFYGKNIPVLFFFTGSHMEYHRPEDRPETLDYPAEAKVLRYVSRVMEGVLEAPAPPPYVAVKSSATEGASRGFRVYLGTIPDYSEEVKGVRLTGVRPGGPADKAGVKGGDIIVKLGDKNIENVYDYTYALQEHKPGETTAIVVLRDGKEVALQVTFEKRAE